jgi:hypothetical protein
MRPHGLTFAVIMACALGGRLQPLGRSLQRPQVIYSHGDHTLIRIRQLADDTATTRSVRVASTSHQGPQRD